MNGNHVRCQVSAAAVLVEGEDEEYPIVPVGQDPANCRFPVVDMGIGESSGEVHGVNGMAHSPYGPRTSGHLDDSLRNVVAEYLIGPFGF